MMTSPWQQKRAQIAQTMRDGVVPGGLGLGNGGATFRTNPMMRFGAPGQAPASGGLMGQAGGGGQMARMAQMPGFNYVPPPTGPAPTAAGTAPAATPEESMASLLFAGPEAQGMVAGASAAELQNMQNAGFFRRGAGGTRR